MSDKIPWTEFYDMHSGGGSKEHTADGREVSKIYIQAPEAEATVIFYNRFGHSPERATCQCCGSDYSVSELEEFRTPTEYREWLAEQDYGPFGEEDRVTIEIPDSDIKPEERLGEVPFEGWVWQG